MKIVVDGKVSLEGDRIAIVLDGGNEFEITQDNSGYSIRVRSEEYNEIAATNGDFRECVNSLSQWGGIYICTSMMFDMLKDDS